MRVLISHRTILSFTPPKIIRIATSRGKRQADTFAPGELNTSHEQFHPFWSLVPHYTAHASLVSDQNCPVAARAKLEIGMADEIKDGVAGMLAAGDYLGALKSEAGKAAIEEFAASIVSAEDAAGSTCAGTDETLLLALASLNAFLQINVTGPVLEDVPAFAPDMEELRKDCLRTLEVDGVSPYQYIPYLELFCLARRIVLSAPGRAGRVEGAGLSLAWMRLRVHIWHYKLLTQPHLGAGSTFAKSSQWSDVPSLISLVSDSMETVRKEVLDREIWAEGESSWSKAEKMECALELVNCEIMLGRDDKAREGLKEAVEMSGLEYVLTGALGKKTKFQDESKSQLVVLARSAEEATGGGAQPEALPLNDDVLLEKTAFDDVRGNGTTDASIPARLKDLGPDAQPQLDPLDQIILLTEATLKDAFSPLDVLTSTEVLPYAQRVLADKSTNWQVYTQALIVRSRTEVHRSRTVERGVLQLQAVVDQIVVDTSPAPGSSEGNVPSIAVTPADSKPTSFLPAPKPNESAPATERLKYVNAVSTPPRWHLESELAYGWAGIGSLVSALEIFKRLRLWPEVALCLASATASDGTERSGGEEKGRGVIRWRLFHRTGQDSSAPPVDADDEKIEDVTRLSGDDWMGPERTPPPNAARLWCILGDIEDEPAHYERAWTLSNARFSRAQRSLGEHYIQKKDFARARDAYSKAVHVNRLSPDMWSRLGDIHLRLGEFEPAAEAFSRAIGAASDVVGGEDARTWSNLGSSLYSMYCDAIDNLRNEATAKADGEEGKAGEEEIANPAKLLGQSLNAYKRGANLSRENWRIWDNVLTLATRTTPPSLVDMVLATQNILRIRQTEEALDSAVLSVLLREGLLMRDREGAVAGKPYEPKRGTIERTVVLLFEDVVAPLITARPELWELVSRERLWRNDYAGSIDASERAWRAAVAKLSDEEASFKELVRRTDELVSALENFGTEVEAIGEKWRGKARSAVRSALGKGRGKWEGGEEWGVLEKLMEGLKNQA